MLAGCQANNTAKVNSGSQIETSQKPAYDTVSMAMQSNDDSVQIFALDGEGVQSYDPMANTSYSEQQSIEVADTYADGGVMVYSLEESLPPQTRQTTSLPSDIPQSAATVARVEAVPVDEIKAMRPMPRQNYPSPFVTIQDDTLTAPERKVITMTAVTEVDEPTESVQGYGKTFPVLSSKGAANPLEGPVMTAP
ncbi:MAG: hypothetical protein CL565_03600 [Alphaproteobacteria bacterium]|nr:hypothetical protein [Alphaproteobacteria bacterium]